MSDTSSTLHETVRIASSIQNMVGVPAAPLMPSRVVDLPVLALPQPLTLDLINLGLPESVAEGISEVYLRDVEGLKTATEKIVQSVCSKLTSLPRFGDIISLEALHKQIFNAHQMRYLATTSEWAAKVKELALSRLTSPLEHSPTSSQQSTHATKRKRQFKSEFLPLFEFAFEKDRFPNREDKKYLAKISGMSYRQVCVWFQNRRCRSASRRKSHLLSPPPQTFEEMKQRLGVSAREAISPRAFPGFNESSCISTRRTSCLSIPTVQDIAWPCDSSERTPLMQLRVVPLGAAEASDSEKRDGLEHYDDMHKNPQLTSMSSFLHELVPRPSNPLKPFKTSSTNVFPAVYKPSRPTANPFIVEHQSWTRSAKVQEITQLIDPSPQAMESIVESFGSMEVDIPMLDSDPPCSLVACNEPESSTLLHTNAPLSLRTPSNSHTSVPRTCSSGSSASWSSHSSASSSSPASYSTAPSSVLSSPNHSEIYLSNQSEYEPAPLTLTAPGPSADKECTCETPVDEVASTAGLYVSSIKTASKARVDEWVSGMSAKPEDDHAADKWQQLLAAAAAEASPEA